MASEHHHSSARRDVGHLAWPLLGLVAIALIGMVVLELETSDDPMPLAEQGAVSEPAPQPPAVLAFHEHDNSPQGVERMLARPLFSQNRRPLARTPGLLAESPTTLPRLTGVVVSPAGSFAIFTRIEGGKPVVVREGDQVGAAIVEAVAAGQVTLRGPEGILVLHPSFGERVLQASRPSPASLARSGYRPRQGGHDAAVLNRKRVPAT
jgi:hypothetical protein